MRSLFFIMVFGYRLILQIGAQDKGLPVGSVHRTSVCVQPGQTAILRMSCLSRGRDFQLWIRTAYFAKSSNSSAKFCENPTPMPGRDCVPDAPSDRWKVASQCNTFSSCTSYPTAGDFLTCDSTGGTTFAFVEYECIPKTKSDGTFIRLISMMSEDNTYDGLSDKFFIMSTGYAQPTSERQLVCQISIPERSELLLRILDFRTRSTQGDPLQCTDTNRLYINNGEAESFRQWCPMEDWFYQEILVPSKGTSGQIVDVVLNLEEGMEAALWILVEVTAANARTGKGTNLLQIPSGISTSTKLPSTTTLTTTLTTTTTLSSTTTTTSTTTPSPPTTSATTTTTTTTESTTTLPTPSTTTTHFIPSSTTTTMQSTTALPITTTTSTTSTSNKPITTSRTSIDNRDSTSRETEQTSTQKISTLSSSESSTVSSISTETLEPSPTMKPNTLTPGPTRPNTLTPGATRPTSPLSSTESQLDTTSKQNRVSTESSFKTESSRFSSLGDIESSVGTLSTLIIDTNETFTPDNGTFPQPENQISSEVAAIVGGIIGGVALLACIIILLTLIIYCTKDNEEKRSLISPSATWSFKRNKRVKIPPQDYLQPSKVEAAPKQAEYRAKPPDDVYDEIADSSTPWGTVREGAQAPTRQLIASSSTSRLHQPSNSDTLHPPRPSLSQKRQDEPKSPRSLKQQGQVRFVQPGGSAVYYPGNDSNLSDDDKLRSMRGVKEKNDAKQSPLAERFSGDGVKSPEVVVRDPRMANNQMIVSGGGDAGVQQNPLYGGGPEIYMY